MPVIIDPRLPIIVPDAVSFETGASRAQASDPSLYVYEHHGDEFGWSDPGALVCFVEDWLLGRPMPPLFASRTVQIDTLVAIALFERRPELLSVPGVYAFAMQADFVHRRGAAALAHIDDTLGLFFMALEGNFAGALSKSELESRVILSTAWIVEYLTDGQLPYFGERPPVRVVQRGTDGFVVAETTGDLRLGWVDLFRQGFTRGILVGPEENARRRVLVAKKGPYVPLRLDIAAQHLNAMETAQGELAGWGNHGLWLSGPEDGTLILVSHLIEVLIRV